jgi:hypothetical protein
LAARPAVKDHQFLGHAPRDRLAEVLGDHGQRHVDARRDPRRGPQVVLADEDAVALHRDVWKEAGEPRALAPVGGGPAAVEQSRGRQDIGARADAAGPPRRRRGLANKADGARALRRPRRPLPAGDEQGVERAGVFKARGDHRRPRRAFHRAGIGGDDHEAIGALDLARGHLEGCDRAGGVEELEAREDQKGDSAHGMKRGIIVIQARR